MPLSSVFKPFLLLLCWDILGYWTAQFSLYRWDDIRATSSFPLLLCCSTQISSPLVSAFAGRQNQRRWEGSSRHSHHVLHSSSFEASCLTLEVRQKNGHIIYGQSRNIIFEVYTTLLKGFSTIENSARRTVWRVDGVPLWPSCYCAPRPAMPGNAMHNGKAWKIPHCGTSVCQLWTCDWRLNAGLVHPLSCRMHTWQYAAIQMVCIRAGDGWPQSWLERQWQGSRCNCWAVAGSIVCLFICLLVCEIPKHGDFLRPLVAGWQWFESKAGCNKDGNKDGLRVGPRDGKAGAGDAKCHRFISLVSGPRF